MASFKADVLDLAVRKSTALLFHPSTGVGQQSNPAPLPRPTEHRIHGTGPLHGRVTKSTTTVMMMMVMMLLMEPPPACYCTRRSILTCLTAQKSSQPSSTPRCSTAASPTDSSSNANTCCSSAGHGVRVTSGGVSGSRHGQNTGQNHSPVPLCPEWRKEQTYGVGRRAKGESRISGQASLQTTLPGGTWRGGWTKAAPRWMVSMLKTATWPYGTSQPPAHIASPSVPPSDQHADIWSQDPSPIHPVPGQCAWAA
jgi:hypothetical protein